MFSLNAQAKNIPYQPLLIKPVHNYNTRNRCNVHMVDISSIVSQVTDLYFTQLKTIII